MTIRSITRGRDQRPKLLGQAYPRTDRMWGSGAGQLGTHTSVFHRNLSKRVGEGVVFV